MFGVISQGAELRRSLAVYLRPAGLTTSDLAILAYLMRNRMRPVYLKEVGGNIGISAGGLTDAIDRLEQRALVYRRRAVGDKRCIAVVLTDKGVAHLTKGFNRSVKAVHGLARALKGRLPG